jgi:hypothetical protein
MALKVYTTNLGTYQWNPTPTFSPIFTPTTLRYKSPSPKLLEFPRSRRDVSVRGSNLVDEQQQIAFTEPENQLIDALIGIQGRGRSASPQQLSVNCLQNSIYTRTSFFCFSFFLVWKNFLQDVERAVQVLEGLEGVPEPVCYFLLFLFCFVLNSRCHFCDLIRIVRIASNF